MGRSSGNFSLPQKIKVIFASLNRYFTENSRWILLRFIIEVMYFTVDGTEETPNKTNFLFPNLKLGVEE